MFYCENLMIYNRYFFLKVSTEIVGKFSVTFSGKQEIYPPSHHFTTCVISYCDTTLVCFVVMWCFTVEVEWCSIGDVGDSADTDVHDAVCQRLWTWWRLRATHRDWQVQECWAPSVHHADISMLVLASDPDRLARVTNQEVGQAPNQETYWA